MADTQHSDLPRSAKEARAIGSRFYVTGNPCVRGHTGLRYTSIQQCLECGPILKQAFLATDAGQQSMKAAQKKYYHANKKSRHANVARWRKANPERAKELFERYIKGDKGREAKLWSQIAREGAPVKARTVFGQEGVPELYAEARRLGLTIDHIDPLNHPLICGLHNRFNLQLLTKEENSQKGNRWTSREIFYMPGM
jgi:5-methylcytosine-specific restriction endonuclease McrA